VASVWIKTRTTKAGAKRYRVEFRVGGRDSKTSYGGSFKTRRLATLRAAWIERELAAQRVPELRRVQAEDSTPTFAAAAQRWRDSRLDVSEGTRVQQRTSVNRAIRILGQHRVDEITPQDVADMVAALHGEGLKPSFVRKIVQAAAMVLDHAGVTPNPARDRVHVRLPREQRPELAPPTADHVLAVHELMPPRYRLPLLVLDATGMRIGELEALTWGDIDEPRVRWRISQAVSKTRRGRWVTPPPSIFQAVSEITPRDDRVCVSRVFLCLV
jgi:integrase